MVYRSKALEETDPLFRPVKDFITNHTPELLVCQQVDDEEMMFGKAEFSVYKPAPITGGFID